MSKKQAIFLFFGAILIGILLVRPFNYLCKYSGWCKPIIISYYLPSAKGETDFNIMFQAKDNSEKVEFRSDQRSVVLRSGSNYEVSYFAKNISDKKINIRPKRFIEPKKAMKYLDFYECLCFKEHEIEPNEEKELSIKFKVKKEIENDKELLNSKIVIIGYEVN